MRYLFFLVSLFVSIGLLSAQEVVVCAHNSDKHDLDYIKKNIKKKNEVVIGDGIFESDMEDIRNKLQCLSDMGKDMVFKTYISSKTNNAYAYEEGGIKYILYDSDYLKSTGDKMAAYGIIAHELAHHVYGPATIHFMEKDSVGQRHRAELAADYFAARLLGRMGADSSSALAMLKNVKVDADDEHPAKKDREKRVREGWQEGKDEKDSDKNTVFLMNCPTKNNSFCDSLYMIGYKKDSVRNDGAIPFDVYIDAKDSNALLNIEKVVYYYNPLFKPCTEELLMSDDNKNFRCRKVNLLGSFDLKVSLFIKEEGQCLLLKKIDIEPKFEISEDNQNMSVPKPRPFWDRLQEIFSF